MSMSRHKDFYGSLDYPGGSIRTTDELNTFINKDIWIASRRFRSCTKYKLVGINSRTSRGRVYPYFKVHIEGDKRYADSERSRLDHNIDSRNGYNDWFIFTNETDAMKHRDNILGK